MLKPVKEGYLDRQTAIGRVVYVSNVFKNKRGTIPVFPVFLSPDAMKLR